MDLHASNVIHKVLQWHAGNSELMPKNILANEMNEVTESLRLALSTSGHVHTYPARGHPCLWFDVRFDLTDQTQENSLD